MREHVDLHRFQEKVDLYFDKALSQSDEKDLLHDVENDSSCQKVFEQTQNYRSFIKNKVHRPSISPDFIESIKDKIRIV